ncbi:MAG: hypothetical protein IJQ50_05120 [Clostridia bacterium]|nr:hypothetical protein [Clostridia bacterium]
MIQSTYDMINFGSDFMLATDFYTDMLQGIILKRRKIQYSGKFEVITLSGFPGTGKTTSVLRYCDTHSGCLYFSFKNTEHSLALKIFAKKYPKIFSDCNDWDSFFSQLCDYCKKRNTVVFFDSFKENTKSSFQDEFMKHFKGSNHLGIFIFIKDECGRNIFTPLHPAEIAKIYPQLSNEDVIRLRAVTGGILSLVDLYNPELSFDENLALFLKDGSYYSYLAERIFSDLFRTPDSYNTLMLGIALGKTKLSELAEFSGFALNKCDKYLNVLCEKGLISSVNSRYRITNEYFYMWYRYKFMGIKIQLDKIKKYIDTVLFKRTFKRECLYWLLNSRFAPRYTEGNFWVSDNIYHNVKIKDEVFDYIYDYGGDTIFVKIFSSLTDHFTKENFVRFKKAADSFNTTQNSTYILFSVHRFSDYCWDMSKKYDNLRLVQLTSLLPGINDEAGYREEELFI